MLLDGFLHLEPRDGVRPGDLRADQQQTVRVHNVFVAHRPAIGALDAAHRFHGVDVPEAGGAIEVVRAYRQAHELLKDIEVLVGAARGDEAADRLRAISQLDLGEPLGQQWEHVLPCGRLKSAVGLAHERHRETIRVVDELIPKVAAGAEIPAVPAFFKR